VVQKSENLKILWSLKLFKNSKILNHCIVEKEKGMSMVGITLYNTE